MSNFRITFLAKILVFFKKIDTIFFVWEVFSIFVARIKYEREKRGWSQKYIAEQTGIPSSNISRYETGERKPDIATLVTLANFMGCSVDYLLGRSDDAAVQSPTQNEELESLLYRKQGHLFYNGVQLKRQDIDDLLSFMKILKNRCCIDGKKTPNENL